MGILCWSLASSCNHQHKLLTFWRFLAIETKRKQYSMIGKTGCYVVYWNW